MPRDTVLIGDARPHDASYTSRRTYFAEPDDGSQGLRHAFAAEQQRRVDALIASSNAPFIKGDPRWMHLPNPIDGKGPNSAAAAQPDMMPRALPRAAGNNRSDLLWQLKLRGGGGGALEENGGWIRDDDVMFGSATCPAPPRPNMLHSGRAQRNARLVFDSAEERAAVGFVDRGLRRAKFARSGLYGSTYHTTSCNAWEGASGGAVGDGVTASRARPSPSSPPAAGGPGGRTMEDWARWGRHHGRGGTHTHAADNLAAAAVQTAQVAQAAAIMHAARRARASGRRQRGPSTGGRHTAGSMLSTPRSGRWVLAVVPAAPSMTTGGLRSQHHQHHRRDFSSEQPHTPTPRHERARADGRGSHRAAAGIVTGFGAPVPDEKANAGATPRPAVATSRTIELTTRPSARTQCGLERDGGGQGRRALTGREQAIEDRYRRRVAQRAAVRRSRRGREPRQL